MNRVSFLLRARENSYLADKYQTYRCLKLFKDGNQLLKKKWISSNNFEYSAAPFCGRLLNSKAVFGFSSLVSLRRLTTRIKQEIVENKEERKETFQIDASKQVEASFQRKSPIEHVLLRPGMYVGSTDRSPSLQFVYDKEGSFMELKTINVSPALLKIFDELLVNAADNKVRDESMTEIRVNIYPGTKIKKDHKNSKSPLISVYNDGKGVPIQYHNAEKLYIPELVFGNLLTGSNFDDNKALTTGGRHGYGAKLTNILSQTFQVETLDSTQGLHYSQRWENNMKKVNSPEIVSSNKKTDYTKITFAPDLKRFNSEDPGVIDQDTLDALYTRVVDIAGCVPGVKVYLNDELIPVSNFNEYCKLYLKGKSPSSSPDLAFLKVNDRWTIGVAASPSATFNHVSFVNSINTNRGGTHVNYIASQVVSSLSSFLKRKYPSLEEYITNPLIKSNLFIFVQSQIENASFDSQAKESLTTKITNFGSTCQIPTSFLKDLEKDSDLVKKIISLARAREQSYSLASIVQATSAKSKAKVQMDIPKLEDALDAGGRDSKSCTLILTEGDSAKALAVAGLEVVGRKRYGVLPLSGKILNVRDTNIKQISANKEFQQLCRVLGLDIRKPDGWINQMRYGKLMIMTDQDHDGSHIKGLLVNMFEYFWPELLERNDFLEAFITPIIKAFRRKEVLSFYSTAEYNTWCKGLKTTTAVNSNSKLSNDIKQWRIKYYKGLGTSTSVEGKEYFNNLANHRRIFKWESDDSKIIDLVFNKKRTDDRKKWMQKHPRSDFNDYIDEDGRSKTVDVTILTMSDFINKELINFSHADLVRSIPSVVDGLKPSQRKVLYSCFRRKDSKNTEIKVAQLAGYVAEHSAYHHGEQSLHGTIINMAQDFVGSNNLPLLKPLGQFGTRLSGGKDAASPRYLFTRLQDYTRKLFPSDDDPLLKQQEDDGQPIEPVNYVPILPLLLINGASGVGTGWSTYIPPHNPLDILKLIRDHLNFIKGKEDRQTAEANERVLEYELTPWVAGFKGYIGPSPDKKSTSFLSSGRWERLSSTKLKITELPYGRWTLDYKKILLRLIEEGEIRDFEERHTTKKAEFIITMSQQKLKSCFPKVSKRKGEKSDHLQQAGSLSFGHKVNKLFALETSMHVSNMHAFDSTGKIKKYNTSQEIISDFLPIRYQLYTRRKEMLLAMKYKQKSFLENKVRFLDEVAHGALRLLFREKLKKEALITKLIELKYDPNPKLDRPFGNNSDDENRTGEESKSADYNGYDYLTAMPIHSFTEEERSKLTSDLKKISTEIQILNQKSEIDMWLEDLDVLENHLKKIVGK